MTGAEAVQIVSRNAIPPVQGLEEGRGLGELAELRDFRWNDQLREFMPDPARLSVSWVRLGRGEVLTPRVHAVQSLMVFYAGSGEMLGDLRRAVAKEDVVVVPAGCAHGFVGGRDGLHALSIQFGEGLYSVPDEPRVTFTDQEQTLAGLLSYNRQRMKEYGGRAVFDLLEDGTLENSERRRTHLAHLRIWADGNRALLLARQASCADPEYRATFQRHMQEWLGSEPLRPEDSPETRAEASARDPVMEAFADWFAHQMYVLDDAEKTAIVHLVVENATHEYLRRATPVFARYATNAEPLGRLGRGDAVHATSAERLLASESPRTYARLQRVVGEAWDMMGAMTDRLVELTLSGPVS